VQFLDLCLAGSLGRLIATVKQAGHAIHRLPLPAPIIVWCTPCLAANSASVRSPRIASIATFALNSEL
jgi:hypothetical protein